jgi:hypothetical protein
MMRSSLVVALGLILSGSVACGGGEKPPNPPTSTPSGTEDAGDTSSSTSIAPVADAGSAASTEPSTPAPPPAPAKLDLPSASAKAKVNPGKALDLEVKSDGSVNSGGKPSAKISGMELQDKDGKAQLKVDADGNITTADGGPYAKFAGDTLTLGTGVTYAIDDTGSLQMTPEKGPAKSLGKVEGAGTAKRAVLLAVAFGQWGTKAPQPKAPKAGDKPAGDKPAGDKPAGKKTPAKK